MVTTARTISLNQPLVTDANSDEQHWGSHLRKLGCALDGIGILTVNPVNMAAVTAKPKLTGLVFFSVLHGVGH
jgi:hypothetical protein